MRNETKMFSASVLFSSLTYCFTAMAPQINVHKWIRLLVYRPNNVLAASQNTETHQISQHKGKGKKKKYESHTQCIASKYVVLCDVICPVSFSQIHSIRYSVFMLSLLSLQCLYAFKRRKIKYPHFDARQHNTQPIEKLTHIRCENLAKIAHLVLPLIEFILNFIRTRTIAFQMLALIIVIQWKML